MLLRSALTGLVVFAAACGGAPAPQSPPPPLDCTLVLLKTGPRTGLSAEQRREVFGGHFANMQRLARERSLLLAGPFGKAKSDAALRGLFVLDTNDAGRARELAETDPGFAAGVFVFDFHALSTHAPLREHLTAELAAEDAAAAMGAKPAVADTIRTYVLMTADDGTQALGALEAHRGVLLAARLDTTKALFVLDAADLAAAEQLLAPVAERIGKRQLSEWASSKGLVELPKRAVL